MRELTAFGLCGGILMGCVHLVPPPEPPPDPPLPPLPVETVERAPRPTPPPAPSVPAIPGGESTPITLSAINVDIRSLLPVLAEEAGVSIVFGPEVVGRISVRFENVPADEALAAVLAEAGLDLVREPMAAPWGPTTFYLLPVNIDGAGVETIRARFGVSREVAEWIVEAREWMW